ncbi:ABC-type multidrug transport system, ATPase and permease component [Lishizhenia tianjinensis]|uniref:ABC-type multidrug transport system, ATPase and permease component n=1 Tax=Lishizhenia tianjinensis TaxID=477690 RepID=A0A1I6XCJ3_9FLAO|nr:ABC transporter ATP-binding protein [Lishizhenia tianjinensis]SFT35752.1 ABC-type multidrug transport system, ATPase and permease component [Lishizhenia tianjinensis]
MLGPRKKGKREKVKLSKESVQKAKGIFSYLKPYSFVFAIGWICLVLSSLSGLAFPYLMGQLLGGESTETPTNMADTVSLINLDNVNDVALLLLVLFGAMSVFSFFRVVLFTNVTENTLRDIRNDAFSKLIYMPMDFFNQNKVGELTSRVSNDITQVQETLRTTIAEFFRQIITVVGSVLFLVLTSWKLALIMLSTVPVIAIIAVFFGRFIRKLSKNAQDFNAESNSIVEEALMGITNIKSFTHEIFTLNKYKKATEEIRNLNVKSGLWRGVFVSFMIFFMTSAIVFIIWQGIKMTQGPDPEISSQQFFSFIMFTIMMGASFGSIPDLYAGIQKSIGAVENLMNIISEKTEFEVKQGSLQPTLEGNISFENVNFAYPQRKDIEVLKGISFEAKKNQTIALVGSSGAGKSTIASLLFNYYDIDSGSIAYDGNKVEDISVEHLRSQMAIVPQEVILFAGTIRENIKFGNVNASEEEIIEATKKANAWVFIKDFPQGLDTEVGDRGIQLSGGQKQRIAIARALLKNPRILILDEATSALDSESERLVQEALENLMEGRTSIVIAHRLSTIRNADKILVLEHGKVVEQGTHNELVQIENGVYANLSQLQLN